MTSLDHPRPATNGGRLTNVSHGNHLGRHGIVLTTTWKAAYETVEGSVWEMGNGNSAIHHTVYGIRFMSPMQDAQNH